MLEKRSQEVAGSPTRDCISTGSDGTTVHMNNYTYDLSALAKGETGYTSSGQGAEYVYYLDVGQEISSLPQSSCSGAQGMCDGSGCSAYQTSPDGSSCYAVGDVDSLSATFYVPVASSVGSPEDGLTLVTSTGGGCMDDKRWLFIRLICGDDSDPGRSVEVPGMECVYEVFWTHSAGCPITPSFATTATMILGAIFLPIGLAVALYGYRLWRCTIFILGFLFFGTICGVIAATPLVQSEIMGLLGQSGTMLDADQQLFIGLAAAIGGTAGGFIFLCLHWVVIFCAGCGCGMLLFAILAIGGMTGYLAANAGASAGTGTEDGLSGADIPVLLILDLLFGIVMKWGWCLSGGTRCASCLARPTTALRWSAPVSFKASSAILRHGSRL